MKITGLLMLPAGWVIVLAALVLLRISIVQNIFVTAGLGVELVGLVLLTHAHLMFQGGNE